MFKKWIYGLFLLVLFAVGLALGAANDATISFDFLFVKKDISLGVVLVIGMIFGLFLGLYISFWMCFKFWRQSRVAKSQVRRLEKSTKTGKESSAE